MSGHTLGPWIAVTGKVCGRDVIAPGQPKIRRTVAQVGGPNRDANAHLIAAAPDLLNALAVLADAAESRGIPCDAARAAIAKATGAQP